MPRYYVLLNLLPLIAFIGIISVFFSISAVQTKKNIIINDKIVTGSGTTVENYNRGDLITKSALNSILHDSSKMQATTNDPQLILSLNSPIIQENNENYYFIIKLDRPVYEPQLYWSENDKNFQENNSTTSFFKTEEGVYWSPLKKEYFGIRVKNSQAISHLRVDPLRSPEIFNIEYIKVIKL